jgi:hypothetical protein
MVVFAWGLINSRVLTVCTLSNVRLYRVELIKSSMMPLLRFNIFPTLCIPESTKFPHLRIE